MHKCTAHKYISYDTSSLYISVRVEGMYNKYTYFLYGTFCNSSSWFSLFFYFLDYTIAKPKMIPHNSYKKKSRKINITKFTRKLCVIQTHLKMYTSNRWTDFKSIYWLSLRVLSWKNYTCTRIKGVFT